MSLGKSKMLRAVFAVALFAVLLWYGVDAYQPKGALATTVTVMVCLAATHGLCALLFRSRDKRPESKPVLAPFLERHVLKPLEERRWEKWREEGQAQARAEIRGRLKQRGLNSDDFLPSEEGYEL
jgi:hypothetical protein